MNFIIFSILSFYSFQILASDLKDQDLAQENEDNFISRGSNIIESFNTLKYLYGQCSIDTFMLYKAQAVKYQRDLLNFFAKLPSIMVLRCLNRLTDDLDLLVIYLSWMGGKLEIDLEISSLDHFILDQNRISLREDSCTRRCKFIESGINYLLDRIQKLASDPVAQDSIDEVNALLTSFGKMRREFNFYFDISSIQYRFDFKFPDINYFHILYFWRDNLAKLYPLSQLDTSFEVYSVSNDLLSISYTKKNQRISKIIYFNYLVTKLCSNYSSIEDFISSLVFSDDQKFTPKQIILILMSNRYRRDPLGMDSFIKNFRPNNATSKVLVKHMFKNLNAQKISSILNSQSDDKNHIKSRFAKHLQNYVPRNYSFSKIEPSNKME
jgi:hypothetical protein